MFYLRVACFDHRGCLTELEEFSLAQASAAWAYFEDHKHKHVRVQIDKVDTDGTLVIRLASLGYSVAAP